MTTKKVTLQITFNYGILAKPLEEQANAHGFTFSKRADVWQKAVDSVHRLYVHEVITDSQEKQILSKLHKKIMKDLIMLDESEAE